MNKQIEDIQFEEVKQFILDPENSSLTSSQKFQLDRIRRASKLLDDNPRLKHVVDKHHFNFPEISLRQAYTDVQIARRLFTTNNNHEYDFWHTWLLNDIVKTIELCRKKSPPDNATIAKCHANMIKALGEKPAKDIDARLIEKNQFIIPIQVNNNVLNIDMRDWMKLDPLIRQEFTKALYGTSEIDNDQAIEIMKS